MSITDQPPSALFADTGPGPVITDVAELVALFADPAVAARRACDARSAGFARRIWIRAAPAHPVPAVAAALRGDALVDLSPAPPDMSRATGPEEHVPSDMSRAPAWPEPHVLARGDRLLVRVEHDQLPAYCAWLVRVAAAATPPHWTLTPVCPRPGGLFRLHLIAAARLALPSAVRVEVRHDLHGVRLAQVALGFGADTLAGPIDAGRHLPLAGVPRPSETSAAALSELVRQAGLEPTTVQEESAP